MRRSYSTKPSPSRSPYSSIQRERAQRRLAAARARAPRRRSSARPPRAGRGRAASRRPCRSSARNQLLRRLPAAQLVDDLPRLGVDRRVVLGRLQLGEHLERAARELGAEEQRLQARDERVAAEDGHEPRHPGGGQARRCRRRRRACAATARSETDCGNAWSRSSQSRAQLRHAQLPGRERRRARASRSSPKRRSAVRGATRRRRATATTSSRSSQRSRGLELDPVATLSAVDRPRCERITCVRAAPRRCGRRARTGSSLLVVAGRDRRAAAARACAGSPSAKSCSLTEKMSAKSLPSSSASSKRDAAPSTGSGR